MPGDGVVSGARPHPLPHRPAAVSVRRPHMSKEQGRGLTIHSLQEVEEGRRRQDQGPTNLCHGYEGIGALR
jgi:hypothetical protein